MKAFIVGASGLVGSHCLAHFKENGWEVLGTHFNFPTNETVYFNFEKDNLDFFFKERNFIPDVIIHCAALTNVDYCENNVQESYVKTVEPTASIVEYCGKNRVNLAYISTDYVFDGIKGPYVETDIVNPINVYGKHKLASENLVNKLPNHLILRITNVYGNEERSKNFIARLIKDANDGAQKDLCLPYDQYASPIYAGDVAGMCFKLATDQKQGIYHLSSTDYFNRFQLATKVLSYFKNNGISLKAVQTQAANQFAKRPLRGGLLSTKFVKEYPAFIFTNVDSFLLKVLKNEL